MSRLPSTRDLQFRRDAAKRVPVEFQHTTDITTYHCKGVVEVCGEDVKCAELFAENDHGDEPTEHMWTVLEQKAETIAWDKENQPRNRRSGCECPPRGAGTLAEIEHERDCPLRLRGEEREAFLDLIRKESRR